MIIIIIIIVIIIIVIIITIIIIIIIIYIYIYIYVYVYTHIEELQRCHQFLFQKPMFGRSYNSKYVDIIMDINSNNN